MSETLTEISEQVLKQTVINRLLNERTEILYNVTHAHHDAHVRALQDNTNALVKLLGEVPKSNP